MTRHATQFIAIVLVFGLVVGSLVILRANAEDVELEPLHYRLAEAIFFGVLTVGPAWLGHYCASRLRGAIQRWRELRRLKKAYRRLLARKKKALAVIGEINRNDMAYQYWATRARGRYAEIWKKAAGTNEIPVAQPDVS